MGIEGVENLTGTEETEAKEPSTAAPVERETDQQIEDRRKAELDAEREVHNRRTAGEKLESD